MVSESVWCDCADDLSSVVSEVVLWLLVKVCLCCRLTRLWRRPVSSLLKIRFLETDEAFSLRGETLQRAIDEDRRRGLVPVMVNESLRESAVSPLLCCCVTVCVCPAAVCDARLHRCVFV